MADELGLNDAIHLAVEAHGYSFDKTGRPIIRHPLRVMEAVMTKYGHIKLGMAAVLHDVIEDTEWTLADLAWKLGDHRDVIHLVDLLTRQEGQTYKEYVDRLCEAEDAMKIKLADVEDNLFHPSRTWTDAPYDRYIKTYKRLKKELREWDD